MLRRRSSRNQLRQAIDTTTMNVPHKGALFRVDDTMEVPTYVLPIVVHAEEDVLLDVTSTSHELVFSRHDFQFASRLFAILDMDSTGIVHRKVVQDFVLKRCPVVSKRDDDIARLQNNTTEETATTTTEQTSPTFEEMWKSVLSCTEKGPAEDGSSSYIGVEAWMVLCRFIALAQYLEAKRRFSARHKQQTMRHRNSPRGSELVMVDVPPPEPPMPLTPQHLVEYTLTTMPELDLDHSLLAAHDKQRGDNGKAKITVFGTKGLLMPSPAELEFAVTFSHGASEVVVRRAMADMEWLNETFRSHKVLGGTLCGRILPPFPVLTRQSSTESESSKTIQAAAAAGVGRIKSAAKWMVGGIRNHRDEPKRGGPSSVVTLPEPTPEGKAHQLERYVNYLLEHPALSTSFPLNAILTASQSGLDAAKLSVAECAKTAEIADPQQAEADESRYNFAWVRTAAQAAMALKVHGMLETTGLPSVSAKLQHAALPNFGPRRSDCDERSWGNDADGEDGDVAEPDREGSNFEDGVVDDDGYDLLPLPVPAPERRILTVGNGTAAPDLTSSLMEERFHYGMGALDDREKRLATEDSGAFLADIAVDQNIDKLREVIGSVDNTLNRCLSSVARIGKAQTQRLQLHQDVVRGLDSWPEMRGRFVSQRSLMKGVAGIEQSREVYEESDANFIEDLSWQAKLAGCAVAAAEDVRGAVRAARTAANARAAASSAALTAEMACEKNKFAHFDEMRALQTRASIAQSHAIHAAVVEHEAKTVKRRSTMALAHDVKTWNIHRKRETLQRCIAFARAQHEATRRSVDAWSSLQNGFVGTVVSPSFVERRVQPDRNLQQPVDQQHPHVEPGEVTATLYEEPVFSGAASDFFAPAPPCDSSSTGTKPDPASSEETPKEEEFSFPFAEAALVQPIESMFGSKADTSLLSSTHSGFPMADHDMQTRSSPVAGKSGEEKLSASMQSLVDGLMSWGGGFDHEDDLALPAGVAASIAMEGNLGIS